MADPLLLLRTVSGLRWRQWAYRPLRALQGRLGAPPAPPAAALHPARAAAMARVWAAAGPGDAAARVARADEVLRGRFRFVGHAEELPAPDWRARPVSPLWTYHLHYFDHACDLAWAFRVRGAAEYARRFQGLAEGWMEGTDAGRGPGWEPFPTALRAVSWMRARLLLGAALPAAAGARIDASLHRQLAWLRRRLEWHILGNHLQKDLHGLVLGGLYFGGADAAEWRTGPLARLWRELFEQVLGDGGHFERSPMYHAIALGDFLELIALLDACGVAVPDDARARVGKMAAAWTRLSRPDGRPWLFNDAAEDGAPDAAWLARLAELALGDRGQPAGMPPRGRGSWVLPEMGYAGWEGADGGRIIVDCGVPGPRYQPGHAHCDALSFELDLGGLPVVVDSGTSGYEGDPLRAYARSTRAHSTVEIGGREQSEVWNTFRVGRMARVRFAEVPAEGAAGFAFAGECVPFHDRRAAHRRRIERRGGAWRVEDRVEGAAGAALRSFVHLHPRCELRIEGARAIASSAEGRVEICTWGADRLRALRGESDPAQAWYSPCFGERTPAPVLELEIDRNDGREFGYELRPL
jgi:uncharacterized heparinase superfamily protein